MSFQKYTARVLLYILAMGQVLETDMESRHQENLVDLAYRQRAYTFTSIYSQLPVVMFFTVKLVICVLYFSYFIIRRAAHYCLFSIPMSRIRGKSSKLFISVSLIHSCSYPKPISSSSSWVQQNFKQSLQKGGKFDFSKLSGLPSQFIYINKAINKAIVWF